ncbi:hypothetical protein [Halomonas rhizosphaerae]|uniref:Uncharacterized protein n=1 Tax=Halomonas rhizosphaerae TaxID=3043296 RepID=A0ABT6V4H1_9GAMM|nr:hypothetical protein [Halomonas rhizosphaerae]MDI5891847.1 hypothetical protein [Halomonas rhizosphaerae]
MKLIGYSLALIIALVTISSVLAADSVYLEERMKGLHDKAGTSIMIPAATPTKAEQIKTSVRGAPATIVTPDPWWH